MHIDFSSFNKHVLNMTIIKVTLIMMLVVNSLPASVRVFASTNNLCKQFGPRSCQTFPESLGGTRSENRFSLKF